MTLAIFSKFPKSLRLTLLIASTAALTISTTAQAADAQSKKAEINLAYTKGDFSIRPRIDVRLRDEYRENMSMDSSIPLAKDRERLLLKAGIGAEISWKFIKLGVDITDGRELIHDTASATGELDFTQLYLGLNNPGGLPLQAKVGRQTWSVGSKRLVASSSWSNKKRSWDGVRIDGKFKSLNASILAGSVVDIESNKLDRADFKEILWGAQAIAQVIPHLSVELYALGIYKDAHRSGAVPIRGENGAIGNENRITPGVRVIADFPSTGLNLEVEGALQVGTRADDDILAYALAADFGWSMPIATTPRLGLAFNYASGDTDAKDGTSETFVPLYGTTHSPYGIADLFRWQNMAELSPSLTFRPHSKLTVKLEQHTYWISQTADAWVNSSGKVLRQGDGNESNYAGQEWSLVAKWKPLKTVTVEAGISRFIGGTYTRDTGDKVGATFGYLSATFTY